MNLKITNCWRIAVAVMAAVFSIQTLQAAPYASGVVNNSGTINFILNEGGGNVYVVFEDGTTNFMGVLAQRRQQFLLWALTPVMPFMSLRLETARQRKSARIRINSRFGIRPVA